ncbi:GNAT family N-acetyltransferase, partial [Deinococcus phoenicis]
LGSTASYPTLRLRQPFCAPPYDPARAASRLADFRREQTEWGWTKWRVQEASGRTVGRGGFGLGDDGQHRELGYLLAPEVWGQGLATELARALTDWHFAHPDPCLLPNCDDSFESSERSEKQKGRGCGGGRISGAFPDVRESEQPRMSPDLLAFAHVENGASRRVLEKVGFTPTGEGHWQGQPHAFYLFPAD